MRRGDAGRLAAEGGDNAEPPASGRDQPEDKRAQCRFKPVAPESGDAPARFSSSGQPQGQIGCAGVQKGCGVAGPKVGRGSDTSRTSWRCANEGVDIVDSWRILAALPLPAQAVAGAAAMETAAPIVARTFLIVVSHLAVQA